MHLSQNDSTEVCAHCAKSIPTNQIVKRLLKTEFISLPNVILGKEVVPELIQDSANGKNIANVAMQIIVSDNSKLVSELRKIHTQLHQESSAQSAKAILEFANE